MGAAVLLLPGGDLGDQAGEGEHECSGGEALVAAVDECAEGAELPGGVP